MKKTNVTEGYFEEQDIENLKKIAEKYSCTMVQLGRLITKTLGGKPITHQLDLPLAFYKMIDENDSYESKNHFFTMAVKWFFDNSISEKLTYHDMSQKPLAGEKIKKINFLITAGVEKYDREIRKLARELSIPIKYLVYSIGIEYYNSTKH